MQYLLYNFFPILLGNASTICAVAPSICAKTLLKKKDCKKYIFNLDIFDKKVH